MVLRPTLSLFTKAQACNYIRLLNGLNDVHFETIEFATLTISNPEKPIVLSGPTTNTLPVYKSTGFQLHPPAEQVK